MEICCIGGIAAAFLRGSVLHAADHRSAPHVLLRQQRLQQQRQRRSDHGCAAARFTGSGLQLLQGEPLGKMRLVPQCIWQGNYWRALHDAASVMQLTSAVARVKSCMGTLITAQHALLPCNQLLATAQACTCLCRDGKQCSCVCFTPALCHAAEVHTNMLHEPDSISLLAAD